MLRIKIKPKFQTRTDRWPSHNQPSFLPNKRGRGFCLPPDTLMFSPFVRREVILRGWASVLNTHSSKEMTDGGENRRYRYLRVSARKKLCIKLSLTPVLTWTQKARSTVTRSSAKRHSLFLEDGYGTWWSWCFKDSDRQTSKWPMKTTSFTWMEQMYFF